MIFAFLANTFGPLPLAQADEFRLPSPGVIVHLSPEFNPPILKGIKVNPDNPFRFDFILDKGDNSQNSSVIARSEATKQSQQEQLKTEATKLIKYFLASLTIPEKDLWVNLSPYEKDRIVPQSFGRTEMGRDLLAEDYMLKQITASLIYPEDEIGKKFWKRIYAEARKKFGTTNIPVNTFNKVWIVPEKAVVYENAKAGTAYVVESKLKVMLEEDYLSMSKHADVGVPSDINRLGSQIIRDIVIPELTREVNEGKNFAQLRQVYNSLILATWYKKKIKDSILSQVYADKNKVKGLSFSNALIGDPQLIYQRYLQAFKKGVYNYIKEEQDPMTQETIPRKYFSGGVDLAMGTTTMNGIYRVVNITKASSLALREIVHAFFPGKLDQVEVNFEALGASLAGFPVNIPQGYELIKNPRLEGLIGLPTVLIRPSKVYYPDEVTLEFMDIISSYIKELDSRTIENNVLRVLDIGTGGGFGAMAALYWAKQKGFQVKMDAVDIKEEAIENAAETQLNEGRRT